MYNPIGVSPEYGEGYVIVPETMNREEYIRRCYNTNSVILFTDMQGVFQNVQVGKQDFDLIVFPDKPKVLGTRVLWMREAMYHHVYVLKVLNKDPYSGFDSGQSVGNMEGQNSATSSYSAKNGTMLHTIQHLDQAVYELNVRSPNKSALHKTQVTGDMETTAQTIVLKAIEDLRLLCGQSNISFDDDLLHIESPKIVLSEGLEAMVKGNTLIKFFDDFITELESTTVNTGIGQMKLINKNKIAKFRELLDNLVSQICFLS